LSFLLSNNNLFNYYVGQILTVTIEFAITFAAFLVEHKDFLATALVVEHFANHFGAFYIRCAYFNLALFVNQEDVLELNRCAFLEVVDAVDEEFFCQPLL